MDFYQPKSVECYNCGHTVSSNAEFIIDHPKSLENMPYESEAVYLCNECPTDSVSKGDYLILRKRSDTGVEST